MDGSSRISAREYRRLAERWRRLAADATTDRARTHLLALAQQCDYLAGGRSAGDAQAEPPQLQ